MLRTLVYRMDVEGRDIEGLRALSSLFDFNYEHLFVGRAYGRSVLACMGMMLLVMPGMTGCQPGNRNHPTTTVRGQLIAGRTRTPEDIDSPTSDPSTPLPSRKPAIAMINDQPLDRSDFIDTLIRSRGLLLLQQIMMREVAQQEVKRMGLKITEADMQHEYDMTLRGESVDEDVDVALTPARRRQLIAQWTRTRGVTREELAIAMERQANLRKIAAGRIKISEEMLQNEYQRVYGEKVEVRHIQLDSQRSYLQIKQRLDQGDRFEDLVEDYSQNRLSRVRQGLLPPFNAQDPTVPPIFAKVAFELKPGEISNPIEAEGSYHVLKLLRRLPADPIQFTEVRDMLRKGLYSRLVTKRMSTLSRDLLLHARIRILDGRLRDQYRQRRQTGLIEGPALRER